MYIIPIILYTVSCRRTVFYVVITFYFIYFCFSIIPDLLHGKVVILLTQTPVGVMDYLTGTIYVALFFLNMFYTATLSSGKVVCNIACTSVMYIFLRRIIAYINDIKTKSILNLCMHPR